MLIWLSAKLTFSSSLVSIGSVFDFNDLIVVWIDSCSVPDRIVIVFTKKDKKVKETSEKTEKLKNNYENFTISSKNNDGIFDVQKIIYNLL